MMMAFSSACKQFAAAGLVVLIYDHFLTFSDELELYWQSKDSFSKYGFLTNRYVVPAMLIAISVGKHHQVSSVSNLNRSELPRILRLVGCYILRRCRYIYFLCATYAQVVPPVVCT
jgi:hypothetical protein